MGINIFVRGKDDGPLALCYITNIKTLEDANFESFKKQMYTQNPRDFLLFKNHCRLGFHSLNIFYFRNMLTGIYLSVQTWEISFL
jgi:hypothetical protein